MLGCLFCWVASMVDISRFPFNTFISFLQVIYSSVTKSPPPVRIFKVVSTFSLVIWTDLLVHSHRRLSENVLFYCSEDGFSRILKWFL
jgi:hypothetical protein